MKKVLGILISLFIYGTGLVQAQCPGIVSPEPTCISVLANGDVTIDFSLASMGGPTPADIDRIEIFYIASSNCAPKVLVGTIPVGAMAWPPFTFTHTGANADKFDACYSIIAYCTGAPATALTESSDMRTVRLESTVTNDFEVNLTWNWDGLSSGVTVDVLRKWPATTGTYVSIANPAYVQGDMAFTDTVVSCSDLVLYKISLGKPSVCVTESSEDSVTILDNTSPIANRLDSVSHDPITQRPLLGWKPSPSKDTRGYIIYRHINGDCGNNEVVDTILGRNSTSLIDMNSSYNGQGPAQYSIVPFDECFNVTGFNGTCVKSMFVTPTLDVCDKSVRLDWNHYEDFETGTDVLYKIFVSIGGSNFVYVDQTNSDVFIHEDPIQNTILTYKIVAFENGGAGPFTATSNFVDVDAEFLKQPQFEYLRYATVADENYVELEMFTDIESDADSYVLKRSLDTGDVYTTVNIFYAPDRKIAADSIVTMSDRSPLTDQFQYFYKVELYDSCGAYMSTSNIGSTILLKIKADNVKRVNRLEWTNVYGWEGGTFAYKIYRFLDGQQLRDPLTKFPDSGRTTVFHDSLLLINDNITGGNPSKGEYCYYIEAVENEPTFSGIGPAFSYSNEVCVTQQPYLSVPNAFTPNGDGRNETFKPVVIYHDITNYHFSVLNRWGEVVYQTSNVGASWDGTMRGQLAPLGVYVYKVKYNASTGQQFEELGTVTLIR